VLHLDGDLMNCEADNLRWGRNDECAAGAQHIATRRLMRPDFLPSNPPRQPPSNRPHKGLVWVASPSIAGWQPITS
jgi:hypothetical protein